MKLCNLDIENYLNEEKIKIFPRPLKENIKGATIDIRLGNKFNFFRKTHTISFVDLSKPKKEINKIMKNLYKTIEINNGEKLFLHSGNLVLAETLEIIQLSNNLVGWIDGRSFLARFGLMVHITSNRIDPGWNDKIVLELYNAGKLPIALSPGMLIGALSFETLSKTSTRPYNSSK